MHSRYSVANISETGEIHDGTRKNQICPLNNNRPNCLCIHHGKIHQEAKSGFAGIVKSLS